MIVNTLEKTVQPQGEDIGELLSKLEEMFPNGQWAEYRIAPEKVIEYHYYPQFPVYPAPYYDQWRVTCTPDTTGGTYTVDPPINWQPEPKFL